jgi:hypothetical protein
MEVKCGLFYAKNAWIITLNGIMGYFYELKIISSKTVDYGFQEIFFGDPPFACNRVDLAGDWMSFQKEI